MNGWKIITSTDDICDLLDSYGGFHDSCLVDLCYRSGTYVNDQNFMVFGLPERYELCMTFHSQWCKQPLELCFNGVRRCNIVGFQNYYASEIDDCYLAYHADLITGRDDPLIVWADSAGFSPYREPHDKLLHEPEITYVIAEKMKWRFVPEQKDQ